MASTDKTPSAERISERVGDLLAASEGRVRELEAEVEDALRGQDKLRGQLLKELAEVGGLQAEVVRLRQIERAAKDVVTDFSLANSPDLLPLSIRKLGDALVASPDKPPERVVRTTITDLDAFN